ncbi:Ribose-5-phosphate isomerase B [Brachyspira suanatina]|uniref:Ribose-5-phosphate isomerase B n=1 Tax=Brachyspira suanatina TaxID=381802 RepID=A0A0G4K834_9SPIR|nr:ribose 5-phosphate isomerase B [Brachyspira suanatina]CRF33959.1 Ribose-5-phosphate isomerase B [Brachyspira suanatina]
MKIAIGCDHSAIELKKEIIKYLEELGHNVTDFGTHSTESVDYPIYGKKVAEEVASGRYEGGVLICGTGIGISLAANKVKGIRAAVCSEPYSAKLSKLHNNSNIIAFGARVVGVDLAKMIVKEWLDAEFEGGRHAKRVGLIMKIENGEEI